VEDREPQGLMDRRVVLFAAIILIPVLFILSVRWVTAHFASARFAPAVQTVQRPTPPATATPLTVPISVDHGHFQTGLSVNSYGCPGCVPYGQTDTQWARGLLDMQEQTGARWVEMEIDLYQHGIDATDVTAQGPTSTPPSAIAYGVRLAHHDGLHVFIVPHLKEGTDAAHNWCGAAVLTSTKAAQAWFASYWQALKPYLEVAQQEGIEQFALNNECNSSSPGLHIEQAPSALWQTLIAEARSVYHYSLGYNMNWQNSRRWSAQPWMSDPGLSYLGISMYQPATNQRQPLSLKQIEAVWSHTFLPELDGFSQACQNKPLILSEIGYTDTADALYRPFDTSAHAPRDPQLQADAYRAAIQAAVGDTRIDGIYFWAWGTGNYGADQFAPNHRPAAQVLRSLYALIAIIEGTMQGTMP
jgi:hypothetical protein